MQCLNTISVESAAAFPAVNSSGPIQFYRFRPGIFLMQILFCIVPSGGLLAVGHATLAGYYFWASLALFLGWDMLVGKRDEVLCLLLATAPFINLLRGFAFYNVIIAVLGCGFLYYLIMAPGAVWSTLNRVPVAVGFFVYTAIYYAISFFNTHQYSVNLRLFELAFTVFFVLLLQRKLVLLSAALVGMMLSAWMVGLAMLPRIGSGRLGMIQMDGQTLGNPTQLGIPLAFAFLALVIDRGRWLGLADKPICRWAMLMVTVPLLALTTSRASWLVAAGGLLICFLFSSRQRVKMLVAIVIVAISVQAVLLSSYGTPLKKGLERTFSKSRSASNRTSGRSDQWKVAYYAFTRSADTIIRGYGPGTSPQVYATYSGEVSGVKYAVGKKVAFHSLFMQVAVEAGAIGLTLLLGALALIFYQIVHRAREWQTIFPFICFVGYLFIVITVSGNDINSGVLLGLGLIGSRSPNFEPSNLSATRSNVKNARMALV